MALQMDCHQVEKKGKYSASQVVLALEQVEFVCGRWSVGGPPLTLEVVSESPRVCLGKGSRDLLAGVIQEMVLTVHSGSSSIAKVLPFLSCILFSVAHQAYVEGRNISKS